MSASRRALTDEESDARRAEQRALADRAVEELRSSSGWQRWLSTRRHFHHYSLLILSGGCRRRVGVDGLC